MKRIRIFEWGDQKWVPAIFRRYFHDLLQHQVELIYFPIISTLIHWLKKNQIDELTDMASGSGGPWCKLLPLVEKEIPDLFLQLSDLHPRKSCSIFYLGQSTDLTKPETWPPGAICVFTAFHHLSQEQAEQLLSTVAKQKRPIFIAEFTERSYSSILGMLFSPIVVWLDSRKLKPMTLWRFFFTYLVPIIPFMYWWDGTVSHLSSFTYNELNLSLIHI